MRSLSLSHNIVRPCLTGVEIAARTFYTPVTFLQLQPDPIDGRALD